MKGNKKLSIIMMLLLVMIMGVACGGDTTADTTTDTTTDAAQDEKVLVIAVDDSYPPMEYRDESNNLVGFDIDFAEALSEETGYKIEFVSTAWDGIFQGLSSDRYDAIISSVSMTGERLENYEFSKPYLANGQVIVVSPDNTTIQTSGDLEGLTIGLQLATTADEAAEKQAAVTPFTIEKYDDIIQTFTAMQAGRLDAIVVDAAVAMDYVSKNPDLYKISSAQLTNEPIAVCMKKGNTELKATLDAAIDTLQENGKLSEISVEWFGEDYTVDIDEQLW